MQSELRKAKTSRASENDEMHNFVASEEPFLEILFPSHPAKTTDPAQTSPGLGTEGSYRSCFNSNLPTVQGDEALANVVSPTFRSGEPS
jgi:hypothetical protein